MEHSTTIANLTDLTAFLQRKGNRFTLAQLQGFADEDYRRRHCYRPVDIPKKNGGTRRLFVPRDDLKLLQRQLLPLLSPAVEALPESVFAYRPGRDLRSHAACHLQPSLLVKLDIRHFFDSISFGSVMWAIDKALRLSPLFSAESHLLSAEIPLSSAEIPVPFVEFSWPSVEESGDPQNVPCWFNKTLSWYLAQFCTQNDSLPQGAPTSPALSNLVFAPLDMQILDFCRQRSITYTRYADDMIFSLPSVGCAALIAFVRTLLSRHGYQLNEEKISVAGPGRRQKITGVVVNEKLQADHHYRQAIRQEIYYIGKYGLREHMTRANKSFIYDKPSGGTPHSSDNPSDAENLPAEADLDVAAMARYVNSLAGRVDYVIQLDPGNREFQRYRQECLNLLNIVYRL